MVRISISTLETTENFLTRQLNENLTGIDLQRARDTFVALNFKDKCYILSTKIIDPDRVYQILQDNRISGDLAESLLLDLLKAKLYEYILDIVTGGSSDITYSSNTTLTNEVLFGKNVTINSGVTLTTKPNQVFVCRSLINNGIINNPNLANAPTPTCVWEGPAGSGGGSIIILAKNLKTGTIRANGGNGANHYGSGSTGRTSGRKGTKGPGFILLTGMSPPGIGGNGGAGNTGSTGGGGGGGGYGGAGGAGGYGMSGGAGGDAADILLMEKEELTNMLFRILINYFVRNVLGKTVTYSFNFPVLGGSSGGTGATQYATTPAAGAGGGGGQGGEVIIIVTTIEAGTIEVKGGNGGPQSNADQGGGGGGSAGVALLIYDYQTGYVNVIATPGSPGASYSAGTSGSSGVSEKTKKPVSVTVKSEETTATEPIIGYNPIRGPVPI